MAESYQVLSWSFMLRVENHSSLSRNVRWMMTCPCPTTLRILPQSQVMLIPAKATASASQDQWPRIPYSGMAWGHAGASGGWAVGMSMSWCTLQLGGDSPYKCPLFGGWAREVAPFMDKFMSVVSWERVKITENPRYHSVWWTMCSRHGYDLNVFSPYIDKNGVVQKWRTS